MSSAAREKRIVIVGAGPAGMTAAGVLATNGMRPVLLDEAAAPGGQVWRRMADDATATRLLGSEAPKYHRVHAAFAAVRDRLDYRPDTLAWGVASDRLHVVSGGAAGTVPFDALILATGATDRTLPLPGWTLPGVFALGGAQALLKGHGCAIGRRVVFCGSSPLLYLAALQYVMAGAGVAAVLDTTPFRSKLVALPRLLDGLGTVRRGLSYMAALRRRGVAVIHGVRPRSIIGTDRVEAIVFSIPDEPDRAMECDAVALGFGLRPETQLAELAGATFRYDPSFRQWFPQTDPDGRCGGALYAAGDGCAIGGADAAETSGALVALAVLADLGQPVPGVADLRRRVRRWRRFQRGMTAAFQWPSPWLAELDDGVPICRCENVTAGDIRETLRLELAPREMNRVKALNRCGMGRCQGRFCGLPAAELVSAELRLPLEQVGRLRGQAPVKPLSQPMVGAS